MSKPSEFHVGVLDFFAILLPGAIAAAILAPVFGPRIFGPLAPPLADDASKWAAFLICAYFLGHLIFLTGSYLDLPYGWLREALSPEKNEAAFRSATAIRDGLITDSDERTALGTFQWARSVLMAKCPTAAEDVHRLEADSKFFRSLVVVCLLSALVLFWSGRETEALVALALTVPCFVRYYERRLKSTTQAYLHIVTLHRLQLLTLAAQDA